ncbi:MAG TPA: hypothetical protein ENO23_07135, partial [Alphaproteobacteria bacterium]|nr:hypothetical protein [Alphaproteobacteria bacterium]
MRGPRKGPHLNPGDLDDGRGARVAGRGVGRCRDRCSWGREVSSGAPMPRARAQQRRSVLRPDGPAATNPLPDCTRPARVTTGLASVPVASHRDRANGTHRRPGTPRTVGAATWVLAGLLAIAGVLPGCSQDSDHDAPGAPTSAANEEPAPTSERGTERPRLVLLLSLDTLRADHLGTYGHSRFTSPNLDLLAAEGVVFEDASSPAPWTLPAHASMLTGLTPLRHGVVKSTTPLPEETPTLASMLQRGGFRTAAIVSVEWLRRKPFGLTREFGRFRLHETPLDRQS